MKQRLPFANESTQGASGADPFVGTISGVAGYKISLRGFFVSFSVATTVTGPASIVISGIPDNTVVSIPGNGSLSFGLSPSTTQGTSVSLTFAEGCVESPSIHDDSLAEPYAITYTITPSGTDEIPYVSVSYWGELIPVNE